MKNRCLDCRHYEWGEIDYSDGWPDENAGPVCGARHGVQNLRQFPFKKTACAEFERKSNAVNQEENKKCM